jgi:deoxyribonuclease-4
LVRLGAHVPTRGGLVAAIEYARALDCAAIQLFISNPRSWAPPTLTAKAAREFAERRAEAGLRSVFAHTSYMVNVASPNPDFRRRSVELARRELHAVAALGGDGLVIHAGSGGPGERRAALERATASLLGIAGERDGPELLVELTAGGAGSVAATLPQAAELFDSVGPSSGVALCLDTCHLFAAGYPLDSPEGVVRSFTELRAHRLSRLLRVVHANDAKDPRGSGRDRHEHIGQGLIGDQGFEAILAEPAVRRAAVLIETPGKVEDDRRNLDRLRSLMR